MKIYEFKDYNSVIMPHIFIGMQDVSLFFVLSGFLITYLLLKEQKEVGKIDVKKYYIRRALRIWPLYFLIIVIGFLVLPYIGQWLNIPYFGLQTKHPAGNFLLCMLFLPPYGIILKAVGPTWSVRVEEIFYLFEPLLLRKAKNYVRVFIIVIIMTLSLRNGYKFMVWALDLGPWFKHFFLVISYYRFSCMAIGGIGAYLVISGKESFLKILYRKDLQWAVYIITVMMLALNFALPFISYEFYSVFFCYIIINLATNPNSVIRLDYKWLNYLGRISYGMYLYSGILRIFCIIIAERIFGNEKITWQMDLFYYFIAFASTIIVSILSYEFFEKVFLRAKIRFEVIKAEV